MIELQTSAGPIRLELFEDKAPNTCANFKNYVKNGFYDGTIFHRVIAGFMVQGGGFDPDMRQRATDAPIENEADNGLSNETGTIAMARTQDPHSASSQFFINVADNTFLDHRAPNVSGWGYCVFGRVAEGMDTVRAIEKTQTGSRNGHGDVPLENIVIEKAVIEPAGD